MKKKRMSTLSAGLHRTDGDYGFGLAVSRLLDRRHRF